MYWGAAKREARLKCDYFFKSLEENIDSFLDKTGDLAHIRGYFRRSMDFIEAYSRCTDGREVVQEMKKFVVKKYLSHRKVRVSSDLSIKAGRPKLLSSRDDQYLVRLVTVKDQENAVEARNTLENDLQKTVSAETVRRSLRRSGLTSFVKPQKPLLSEVNRRKRLDWALNHTDWTMEDWKRVIWSDETKVNRFGSDGKVYAWKQPNEKLKRRHKKQTVKHGGGSLMVWSCISWYGVGYIVDVGRNIDKSVYLSVLQDDLVKCMTDYCKENGLRMTDFKFMLDNNPKHKSKIVSEWLSKQDFTTME
ncbi:hypothetical protein RO3G_16550 [Rhizopus delemar RA 99-880]|uniref:Transposase Tc1-like domain-containing protein n=1 Tax=Rhizopus delemar (strain RA 99-880 / ATCC MYA-4621 / FGSC 9543 / NRRL 43880) TaxID=246409 RepID=I1CTQ9_RHIO9|nr:hypothetical protein RO3G_16550 [Rhizopus delemar RA 99-880]|eukprot:EIE91839.1 hypothetical protein RO3G_16550 [Rhizopus delemar RA 99-880]